MISPENYYCQNAFDLEMEKILTRSILVGTKNKIPDEESYYSFLLGRHALTLRRNQSNPSLLKNVCLHRSCLIDPLGTGNRPFRCDYHGWRYETDGKLKKIPLIQAPKISSCALDNYPVCNTEGLYLASLRLEALDEIAQETSELLQSLAIKQAPTFHQDSLVHKCNWKLLVENVLEGYHLNFVHSETFLAAGINSSTEGELYLGKNTSWIKATPENSNIRNAIQHFKGADHHYWHGYIFPNAFLSNTNNLVGYTGYLKPVSSQETILHWELFELPALQALPNSVRRKIREDAINFSYTSIHEDKEIVERCQLGIEASCNTYQLQEQEKRIAHFHNIYKNFIE